MARGLENDEFAVRYLPVHIVADCHGGDHILTALENEGRDRNLREVGAIVGVKRDARELLCDIGIGTTEAVGEFCGKLRPVRV